MTAAAPPTSGRLRRAADAERAELDRHQERLERERRRLREELDRIDAALADVDERRRLLDRLAPRAKEAAVVAAGSDLPDPANESTTVLRGPAIREAAVRLLLDAPDGVEALHYRDWYARLRDTGCEVAGKDPLAVFLTQITRSPLVRKSTQPGVYEIDRSAPGRLRARVSALHEELRRLTAPPTATADLGEIRARRDELNAEIGQTEKAYEEAERLLRPDEPVAIAVAG